MEYFALGVLSGIAVWLAFKGVIILLDYIMDM